MSGAENSRQVPPNRIRLANSAPLNPVGDYVLYWMSAFRRSGWNFALQRAAQMAEQLGKGLLVLEALRCDYPYASDRLHRFVLDGMADNAAAFANGPARYYPYVEPKQGGGKGLLAALAQRACLVVADDAPILFLPRMLAAAAARLPVALEAVDSNGLLPLRAADHDYPSAYAFRRFLQRELPAHLLSLPLADPLQGLNLPPVHLAAPLAERWPQADAALTAPGASLTYLPIDHSVDATSIRGGTCAGKDQLDTFLRLRLHRYLERSEPAETLSSGLSPYLHFGHIASQQIFAAIAAREEWSVGDLGPERRGQRQGWWGMSPPAEAFLDQLVTWRELGYNFASIRSDGIDYTSLPEWARQTLDHHAGDPRPVRYNREELGAALTHDPLWNAAQRQLVQEGTIHNYLRMLWGKKILEWSASPQQAMAIMFQLNDRYALDGRDPNSASGIGWCLGRYDRPWGPERPIFGKIRYMSSANTARKFRLGTYLKDYGTD
ncbi:deoxyribodipyrimidine photo-lyase [Desulfuromonas sp. DDH964]|uniref:deoxyribodipyrimidine photolyase n=1 Tax=Desulfuromonas sp. DDH964 TaxID=1823759 RepID=UPI00078CB9CC|nr:deoxyribodipyrimidine photolyase [Desulfuromonas sp. DDH964]AMV73333.1 deoxyribodipyrimidine photo-lyase [Desulfuromonas sp. DDH964]